MYVYIYPSIPAFFAFTFTFHAFLLLYIPAWPHAQTTYVACNRDVTGAGVRENGKNNVEQQNGACVLRMVCGLQKVKAIVRCKMHHLDPQCAGRTRICHCGCSRTRLVGWESSGPRDCGPEGKRWFEGGEQVFAEVILLRGKSGLVRMGTGVVAHAAETSRLCFGRWLLGLMLKRVLARHADMR